MQLQLHAYALRVPDPSAPGGIREYRAPIPPHMRRLLEAFSFPLQPQFTWPSDEEPKPAKKSAWAARGKAADRKGRVRPSDKKQARTKPRSKVTAPKKARGGRQGTAGRSTASKGGKARSLRRQTVRARTGAK